MAMVLYAPRASAYEQYSENRDATNCRECHGDFRASPYFSLVDQAFWVDDAHSVHSFDMLDEDCSACHSSGGFFPVLIGSSAGDGNGFFEIGCVGCHGRALDEGGIIPGKPPAGYGAGLRQHHTNAGELICMLCHSDAVLANYTPVGEDVLPDYYFMPTPDPAHPNKPTDSCNPNGEEDYAGSLLGLDNDGNGLYDGNDPVCVCGNGIIDPSEDCDDGNTVGGDCCSATCQFEPAGSPCPDGAFCNGDETCDGAGTCQAGTPVDCSDGVGCTDDSCDEGNDVCVNDPNDLNCPDDGLFCTGIEFCDAVSDCSSTGDPCEAGTICDDATDTCEPLEGCGDGIIEPPGEECDDGNILDGDCCSALCQFEPAGSPCLDGAFCNGDETCDGAETCEAVPVDCSDGVDCTVDSCNEATDSCDNTPDDALCDNGLFCDGIEICDPVNDCSTTGDPCADGTVCNEEMGTCDAEGGGGGCQLQPPGGGRSGMSNAGSAILILLCVCTVLLHERRRRRVPATRR